MTRRLADHHTIGAVRGHRPSHPRIFAATLAAALTSGFAPSMTPALARAGTQGHPSQAPGLTTLLFEIGFTPDLLAAANGRAGVVASLRTAASAQGLLLESATEANQARAGAKAMLEGLKGRVLTSGAAPGAAAAIAQAEQESAQAQQSADAAAAALREALLADAESAWPSLDADFLRAAWTSPAPANLPAEYRAVGLSAEQFSLLASACESASATPDGAAQLGADQQAMLSWANAQPSVIAAKQRLAAYKGELELAFAQAMFAEAAGQ